RCRSRAACGHLCRSARLDDISAGRAGTYPPILPGTPSSAPPAVVQPPVAKHVAACAWVDVGLSRGFVGGDHGVANRVGHLAELAEIGAAAGRHGTLHSALIPERVPFAIERANNAPFVAVLTEGAPAGVQDV